MEKRKQWSWGWVCTRCKWKSIRRETPVKPNVVVTPRCQKCKAVMELAVEEKK